MKHLEAKLCFFLSGSFIWPALVYLKVSFILGMMLLLLSAFVFLLGSHLIENPR